MTLQEWYNDWKDNRVGLERLGQAFCNDFIRCEYGSLYYETSTYKAFMEIKEWLERHHYYDKMPTKAKILH